MGAENLDFLNAETLASIFREARETPPSTPSLAQWADAMRATLPRFGIDTPTRVAAFLGQTIHESAGFTRLEENMARYTPANLERIFQVSPEEARQIAGNAEVVGERVYGNRPRLANTHPGDGYAFRGRGVIQLTGRDNYTRCSQALFERNVLPAPDALVQTPDLAARDPSIALATACWFWTSQNLNTLADQCSGDSVRSQYDALTQCVNHAGLGSAQRYAIFQSALRAFAASSAGETAAANAANAAGAATESVTEAPNAPAPAAQASPNEAAEHPTKTATPKPRDGSVLTALLAAVLGLLAFVKAGIEAIGSQVDALRMAILSRYHVDPLWVAAGLFTLAILFVIFVRLEHHGKLKAITDARAK